MMKIVAIVLSMSVLVASQDFFGDGMGGLLALNMMSGGQGFNFNSLFGGPIMPQQPAAPVRTRGARPQGGAAATAGSYGNLAGLLVMDVI